MSCATTTGSKLVGVLEEVKAKILELNAPPVDLTGKVVVADDENDLLDILKGVKSFPAVGIIYEGMRAMSEQGSSGKIGLSVEIVLSIVLVEQGDAIQSSREKKTRAIEYLEAIRLKFMGEKSDVTKHYWRFMVESPVALRSGTLCWAQRWALPSQLPHNR